MAYVIKDSDGNYVSNDVGFILTDDGWTYCYFTGATTGFTFYENLRDVNKDIKKIQQISNKYGFKKKFYIERTNLHLLKKGKCVVEEINSHKKESFAYI